MAQNPHNETETGSLPSPASQCFPFKWQFINCLSTQHPAMLSLHCPHTAKADTEIQVHHLQCEAAILKEGVEKFPTTRHLPNPSRPSSSVLVFCKPGSLSESPGSSSSVLNQEHQNLWWLGPGTCISQMLLR